MRGHELIPLTGFRVHRVHQNSANKNLILGPEPKTQKSYATDGSMPNLNPEALNS